MPVSAGGNTIRLSPTTAAGLPNIDYLDFESANAPSVPYSNVPDGFAQGTTGGAGGQTVTVTTQADLNRYVTASEPYVIRGAGTIDISPKGTELRVASDKTILGVGTSGHIVGGGFFLGAGVWNVIIRNLTIRDTRMPDDDPGDDTYDYDAIQMDTPRTGSGLRQSGSIVVNSTGKQQTGGSAFNPSSFYSYTLHNAADAPNLLRTHAGPQATIGS